MRAIYDSLERESELQRQLRRTKEALVSVALRLQVSIKLANEDEETLTALQAQAEESKSREVVASKRAEEAMMLINALTLEVNTLKRRLRAYEVERGEKIGTGNSGLSLQQQLAMNEKADLEVDRLLAQPAQSLLTAPPDIGPLALQSATPFDKWKMTNFLYSPDTPAASLAHDKHVVELLMEAATAEVVNDIRAQRTVSSIAKSKRLVKRLNNDEMLRQHSSMTRIAANDLEGLCDLPPLTAPLTASSQQQQAQAPQLATEQQRFFLPGSPERWGAKPLFEHDNMGRSNLWTGHDNQHQHSHPVQRQKTPVRLKSLDQATIVGSKSSSHKVSI